MHNGIPRVCVVGSSNMDLTFRAPRLPRPGETLAGHGFQTGFGGKGANQAVMAARLGADVRIVTRVGRDPFGLQIEQNYREQGVDTSYLIADSAQPTGVAAIVVDDQAQNCIVIVPGANAALSPDDVRRSAPAIRDADVLLAQLEVPVETVVEAFRLARAAGVRTVLNPAPARPLPEELLALTDLCVPNETELETLTGQPTADRGQALLAARLLCPSRLPRLLVTLGAQGALLLEAESAEGIEPMPVTAVDPTGAGDAFIGGLAVFWAQGLSLREAARRANVVAALSVTRAGAQSSFPSKAEFEAALV